MTLGGPGEGLIPVLQIREPSYQGAHPSYSHFDTWATWSQVVITSAPCGWAVWGRGEDLRAHTAVPLPVCLGLCLHVCPSWASLLQERS